jgi:serine/threonine protein kinase
VPGTSDFPKLAAGTELAPGLRVVGHRHRGPDSDLYDAWCDDRLCSVVAKVVRSDREHEPRVRDRAVAEGALLSRLAHPNIVRCLDVHSPDAAAIPTTCPVTVLELVEGPSLHVLVSATDTRVAWPDLVTWFVQLCGAIGYLHRRGQLHLDVKPANVVIGPTGAVLVDFHLAREPSPVPQGLGTRRYMSPEQAEGGEATAASDVWGLGVTMFETAAGRAAVVDDPDDPGRATDSAASGTYPQLLARPPAIRSLRALPRTVAEAIDSCLHPDPARRPSPEQLIAHLQQ